MTIEFGEIRKNRQFADVTLACMDGGHQMELHTSKTELENICTLEKYTFFILLFFPEHSQRA